MCSIPAIILIVEDNERLREALSEALHFYGYQIATAATVQEAEEVKHRLGISGIDLVITDLHLTSGPQGQEGYVLFQRWTEEHPTLPFILISGDPSSEALPAIRSGALRFLLKPFEFDALLNVVRDALRHLLHGIFDPWRVIEYSSNPG